MKLKISLISISAFLLLSVNTGCQKNDPKKAEFLANQAMNSLTNKNPQQAESLQREAIENDPSDKHKLALGMILASEGKAAEARDVFNGLLTSKDTIIVKRSADMLKDKKIEELGELYKKILASDIKPNL
ncbi:MAG: hypothetical protein QM758_18525 [Armatimonas sp.]